MILNKPPWNIRGAFVALAAATVMILTAAFRRPGIWMSDALVPCAVLVMLLALMLIRRSW